MTLQELNLESTEGDNRRVIEAPIQRISQPPKRPEKKKKFWDLMFNKDKIQKQKKVAVVFLKNDRTAVPMEVEPKNGFFNINGKTYHENRDCIYTMTKDRIPLAIIPEWSMIPIGTKFWEDKDMLEKFAELQDHALKGIRHAELVKMGEKDGSRKVNMKVAFGILIMIIIGFVVFKSYF